ncbi:uncharacterized protein MELLADRAFT_102994 [Melampsora larici-populina 98AG31]|uniref:Uncharacterized protein n=1 Tax=Melampsora larici-populina (strain 98AG31 / pathotype 3-4-7) TaxID=747676 RepID=F4RA76_MELLP|nr:uncharacterized protein MELLADRAFT_102994 [Melampsora larici-populina 98AG31]EGG10829.1 hypothetical protein MELLADRAFT_102994 [Melampsora larici-populina 98AG31]
MAHTISQNMMWKIIWKTFLLVNSNSALQPNITPLTTEQRFEEGGMDLGEIIVPEENWSDVNTLTSQDLLQLHLIKQDEINKHSTHYDSSPGVLQMYDQNKPFSHFEEGYQGHQSSQHENLYSNLDTYWNAHSHLGMFSQPASLDSSPANPLWEIEKTVQQSKDMIHKTPTSKTDLYELLDSDIETFNPHKRPKFTRLENMFSSIIDSQEYSLPGKGRVVEMDMAQSVTPQVQSCLQDSISKQPYTLNDIIINPSNMDHKRQFFKQSQAAQYESSASHTNLYGCSEKNQFNLHPHDEFKPTWTTIDEINSPMNEEIPNFTSVSKDSRSLADSIQDPSPTVNNLPRDFWMEKYNMGLENLHRNSYIHLANLDGTSLHKGLTREKEIENPTSVPQEDSTSSDLIDIHIPEGHAHLISSNLGTAQLEEAVNIPPDTTTSIPKSSTNMEKDHSMITENKLEPRHSASVIGFKFAEKSPITGFSRARSNRLVLALQRIGEFLVNSSSALCYETTIWFENLRQEMIKNNYDQEESAVDLIDLAIKLSHLKITMGFLGLIGVFANNGGNQYSLEMLLKEAWEFIKLHFEQWRNLNVNDKNENQAKRKDFNQDDWKDPILWFHYLSRLEQHSDLAVDSMYHLMDKWDDQRTTSRINAKPLLWYCSEIKTFHDSHLKHIHGGFYGRGEIRNIAFKGVKLSGKYAASPGASKEGSWYKIYKFLSYSAQFHSSVGFDMCQEVHTFFVSLLEHMTKFQKGILNDDITYAVKRPRAKKVSSYRNPADENVEKIVKVISMAEYRVTVGFIGLVRVLYQNELPVVTLSLVLKSAWEFLKGIFSKWMDFQFEKNLSLNLNRQSLIQHRITLDYTNSNDLFNVLWQFQDVLHNPVPVHCLPSLFQCWNNHLENLKKLHPKDFNFEITDLLYGPPSSWSKRFE